MVFAFLGIGKCKQRYNSRHTIVVLVAVFLLSTSTLPTPVSGVNQCKSNDGWCSSDKYASRNTFVVWLTAISFGLFLLLWYEKKLMVMILLWWSTVICFIYVKSFILWMLVLFVDLILYYIVVVGTDTPLDPFGQIRIKNMFLKLVTKKIIEKKKQQEKKVRGTQDRLKERSKALQKKAKKMGFLSTTNKNKTNQKNSYNPFVWLRKMGSNMRESVVSNVSRSMNNNRFSFSLMRKSVASALNRKKKKKARIYEDTNDDDERESDSEYEDDEDDDEEEEKRDDNDTESEEHTRHRDLVMGSRKTGIKNTRGRGTVVEVAATAEEDTDTDTETEEVLFNVD